MSVCEMQRCECVNVCCREGLNVCGVWNRAICELLGWHLYKCEYVHICSSSSMKGEFKDSLCECK